MRTVRMSATDQNNEYIHDYLARNPKLSFELFHLCLCESIKFHSSRKSFSLYLFISISISLSLSGKNSGVALSAIHAEMHSISF